MMKMRIIYLLIIALIILTATQYIKAVNHSPSLPVWPTYKYSFGHTGAVDIKEVSGTRNYRFIEYDLLWKAHSNLCIASSPAVGDINKDGYMEVAYSSCDGYLYVVNGSNGEILWKYATGGEFADPTIYDINRDGYMEILSVGASGNLYCLNYDGSEKWIVKDRMFSGSPAISDVDGDGQVEVLMGSNDGYLYVIGWNGTIKAKVLVGDMPVNTPSLSDLDGDGLDEVVVVEGSFIHVIDYSVEKHGYVVYGLDLGVSYLVSPPVLYDVNRDGSDDAIVVSKDAHVFIVDLVNGYILGDNKLNATDTMASPSIGDVDGDGAPEIVVVSMDGTYILNLNLEVKYYFPELVDYASSPIITDIDGDGENEILMGLHTGEFVIVNATIRGGWFREVEWLYSTDTPIMGSPAVIDVDRDGLPEILIGSRDYNMYCFKGIPGQTHKTTTTTITASTTTTTTTMTAQPTTITTTTTIPTKTSTTMTTTAPTTTTTYTIPMSSTTSTSGSTTTTSWKTTRKINLPTTTGHYIPKLDYPLIITAIAISALIMIIVYVLTKNR